VRTLVAGGAVGHPALRRIQLSKSLPTPSGETLLRRERDHTPIKADRVKPYGSKVEVYPAGFRKPVSRQDLQASRGLPPLAAGGPPLPARGSPPAGGRIAPAGERLAPSRRKVRPCGREARPFRRTVRPSRRKARRCRPEDFFFRREARRWRREDFRRRRIAASLPRLHLRRLKPCQSSGKSLRRFLPASGRHRSASRHCRGSSHQ